METVKTVIISTDTGFNGVKCVVGTAEGDELFHFHTESAIYESTGSTGVGSNNEGISDIIYIKQENDCAKRTFICGKKAKQYITTPDGRAYAESDPFYKKGITDEDDYMRFQTDSFKKLHLAVLYRAVKTLETLPGYENIIMEPDKFHISIVVELPHAIINKEIYKTIISGYIKNRDTELTYMTNNETSYDKMPKVIENASISFESQVISALICELESDETMETPVFALDCGGKTIGRAIIEETMDIAKGASSTRDFAVENINKQVVDELDNLTNGEYKIDVNQVEEKGSIDKTTFYWSKEEQIQKEVNVYRVYKKVATDVAKALAEDCFETYGDDIGRCRTVLIAGGAGAAYYEVLKSIFEKKLSAKIVLADGIINGEKNGSIFSVAAGGFKIESIKYLSAQD